MTDPKIIDGKATSLQILAELAEEVRSFSREFRPPHLAVILVGEDPASQVYVRGKMRSAEKTGIESTQITLPAETSEETVLEKVESLNGDDGVDGVLVQLPLPGHIDQQRVIECISPSKDVDGFHPYNLGRLAADKPVFVPCTPFGIRELLTRYEVSTEGKHVVVIGRSIIVGKPMALLLTRKGGSGNATVTICHSRTSDLERISARADILVAAIGKAEFVKGEMIKEGAVVIDVGVNRVDDPGSKKGYRLVGDVDFQAAYERASLITPVPGGVGPMTRAMLMKNTLLAAKRARGDIDGS
ncbi:MAG: bifunctional methylenetetrahydrofolate dehydrogenase/methenyltetrahydrofolate cyclohydrolase FolD [Candidatus Krumholzibacteria bacterium]|nr:bifunctional methylenetetrahydrofolate dehydrogenase/methenyltetrahydrofolate cyclohydrolase FolD [Candidatus Krumholzibacteria bacterium]